MQTTGFEPAALNWQNATCYQLHHAYLRVSNIGFSSTLPSILNASVVGETRLWKTKDPREPGSFACQFKAHRVCQKILLLGVMQGIRER